MSWFSNFINYLQKRWLTIGVIVMTIFLVKLFAIAVYHVPTGSMLPNIWPGDWIVVNKLGYGGQFNLLGRNIQLPFVRSIERGDVMVFRFPEGDTVLIRDWKRNYYELKRWLTYNGQMEQLASWGEKVWLPLLYRIPYVKRCIGLPGDTISVQKGLIYINGCELKEEVDIRKLYTIDNSEFRDSLIYNMQEIPFNGWKEKDKVVIALSEPEKKMVMELVAMDSIVAIEDNRYLVNRFPFGLTYDKRWTPDNLMPIFIPKAGCSVNLSSANVNIYRRVIEVYENNHVEYLKGKLIVNGKEEEKYTFKKDYFFVIGDNRSFSSDSRNWGFVPRDHMIGKAMMVCWSCKADNTTLFGIRWGRLGGLLNNKF